MTRQVDVMQKLLGDPQLRDLGVRLIRRSGAVDTPQEDCFIVARWGSDSPAYGAVSSDRVVLWVYDSPGYYDRIDEVMAYLRDTWTKTGTDLYMEYGGVSDDLYDDMWARSVRNISFTVV